MSSNDTKIKRVFILGAGFSKQAGMPLATDLMDRMLRKFRERRVGDALKWFDGLRERINWLEGVRSNSINIEQVFDIASSDVEPWKMKQQLWPLGRKSVDSPWDTAQCIEGWLKWMEEFLFVIELLHSKFI